MAKLPKDIKDLAGNVFKPIAAHHFPRSLPHAAPQPIEQVCKFYPLDVWLVDRGTARGGFYKAAFTVNAATGQIAGCLLSIDVERTERLHQGTGPAPAGERCNSDPEDERVSYALMEKRKARGNGK